MKLYRPRFPYHLQLYRSYTYLFRHKHLLKSVELNTLSKRGYSKIRALDADTDHFYADFKEGYGFGVSQEQRMSTAESKRFYEVRTFMYDLIKDAEGVTEIIPAGSESSVDEGDASAAKTFSDLRKLC